MGDSEEAAAAAPQAHSVNYTVRIGRGATADIQHAYDWYESQQPGLGEKSGHALQVYLARLESYPMAYTIVYGTARRLLISPFPYHLYFRVRGRRVKVLALIHAARNPETSRRRLGG